MKSQTIASVVEANRLNSDKAYIVLLEIDVKEPNSPTVIETLRVCANTENVVRLGETYVPFPFEIELRSELGEAPEITLSAHDVTGIIRQRLNDHSGGSGFVVRVLAVGSATPDIAEILEAFKVVGATASDYRVSIRLGAENLVSSAFPKRRQFRGSCSFVYKGVECAYAGGLATCDRSLSGANGCEAHANAKNFGGFPALGGT